MNIVIGKYVLSVRVELRPVSYNPLTWPKQAQRRLAHKIKRLIGTSVLAPGDYSTTITFQNNKIGRIKACRYLGGMNEGGMPAITLVDSKNFVEVAFKDAGWLEEIAI